MPDATPNIERSSEPKPDTVYFNGIDPETGDYAIKPMSTDELAALVRQHPEVKTTPAKGAEGFEAFTAPFGIDLTDLADTGWGVVFAEDAPQALRDAVAALVEFRRKKAGGLLKILDYKNGEQIRQWYQRHNLAFGEFEPTNVPYYLLLVGPPTSIPFEFQYLLGVEYAVGRLAFDSFEEYTRYATSVVAYEEAAAVANSKDVVYWGTKHAGDPATTLSASLLLDPLVNGVADGPPSQKKSLHATLGYGGKAYVEEGGVRKALLSTLSLPKPPALLFTASHGMAIKSGRPNQMTDNGGLLCQDWPGFGSVKREHFVSAADVPDDANVNGMIAFLFACFGGGTPDADEFVMDLSNAADAPLVAPKPFVAALPRRLLAHPRGSALAVIGHIDRAWGCSIRPAKLTGAHIAPFRNGLSFILDGSPVGHAMSQQFGQRYTALAAVLTTALKPGLPENMRPTDRELASYWLETNDARNYVVLGDPAVRIRKDRLV